MFSYKKFDKIIKSMGVTAYRVCKETDIATATITGWKNGLYTPKIDKIQKIAAYLGVNILDLMGDD